MGSTFVEVTWEDERARAGRRGATDVKIDHRRRKGAPPQRPQGPAGRSGTRSPEIRRDLVRFDTRNDVLLASNIFNIFVNI